MIFTTSPVDTQYELDVRPVGGNSKDYLKQPVLSLKNIIPRLLTSSLLVGRSGSGKSVLMSFMLDNTNMYKDVFELKLLISPTANTDDVQKMFGADEVIDDLDEADGFLEKVMNLQKLKIEKFGSANAPKICIIFDDCVGDVKFLNSKSFTAAFVKARHVNFTVFCLTQQFKAIPKKCRLQTNNLFFFKSSDSETMAVVEDFCPPGYNRKRFMQLIHYANGDDHSFLYVNQKVRFSERYRKNFGEIIILDNK
jgi:hypothetical protein